MRAVIVAKDPSRLEGAVRAVATATGCSLRALALPALVDDPTTQSDLAILGHPALRAADLVITDDRRFRESAASEAGLTPDHILCLPGEVPGDVVEDVLRLAIDRRAIRQQLTQTTRRQALFLETAAEGVWVVDASCCTTFVNDRMAAMLGYSVEEMLGTWMFELMADGSDELSLASNSGESATRSEQHEFRFRSKDGSDVWALLSTAPILDDAGVYLGALAMVTDITAQKAAATALRRNEESLALTLDSIGEAVIATDLEGRVERMNAVAETLTGIRMTDARRRPISSVVRLFADSACTRSVEVSLSPDVRMSETSQSWLLPHDGEPRAVVDAASPMRDARGRICGAVVVLRDLTSEQRAVEAADQARRNYLRAEEERKKAKARLLVAERMASIGTMAAGVAHEINNPLAYVLGNVEIVETELLGVLEGHEEKDTPIAIDPVTFASWRKALEDARTGANRVRAIVRDLKTFSRDSEATERGADPRAVLKSSLTLADNEIRHRARVVECLRDVPPVAAGESRLGQVLLNLIVNAAQAMEAGDIDANVLTARTFTDRNGWAVIEICDSGKGIAAEDLPKIFDPFFTTKPVGGGTGLGLSICHGIVSEAGGSIEAYSRVGVGTTMRVRLPPAPVAATTLTQATPGAPASPRERTGERSRILVIDDEPLVCSWVHRVLKRVHDVQTTSSGEDALHRIEEGERFDLILCDLMMPRMTGMAVHAAIARAAPEQAARMAFVSGGVFTDEARRFLDRQPERPLEKPFSSDVLRGFVASRLRGQPPVDALSSPRRGREDARPRESTISRKPGGGEARNA
jgi:PAS domain S-box-containing protein